MSTSYSIPKEKIEETPDSIGASVTWKGHSTPLNGIEVTGGFAYQQVRLSLEEWIEFLTVRGTLAMK